MGGKLGNHDLIVLQHGNGLNNKFGHVCKYAEKLTLKLLSEWLLINNLGVIIRLACTVQKMETKSISTGYGQNIRFLLNHFL